MLSIKVRNVSEGLMTALTLLEQVGVSRETRNGPVIAFPSPVATTYHRPYERVLCSPIRRANPVFHLMEAIWMLAGRDDVQFPATFVKQLRQYSDDSLSLHGAYGFRWRHWFGWDQLKGAVEELSKNPQTRRVVIGMWDAGHVYDEEAGGDFMVGSKGGKDVPCNTHIYLDVRDGKLNMTVCCRSNDILWGCYGANAVHFSMLQEYIAHAVRVPVGWYTQISNDLHLYESTVPAVGTMILATNVEENNIYRKYGVQATPILALGETIEDLDDDIETFFDSFDREKRVEFIHTAQFHTEFFNFTVAPMLMAWVSRKKPAEAHVMAEHIRSQDWAWATREWLEGLK